MSHRKHVKKPQGEIVATSASPKEKPQKCQKAFENRKAYKKEYVNVPINITIGNAATTDALRELRKLIGPRYFITILSIRKELNAFEAAEYIKKGFKVEIVEE